MVDLMIMIVQNLRFFLTAVIPTAVILWNQAISHQFRHLGILNIMIPVYLYTCVFVYLCMCVCVYVCMCIKEKRDPGTQDPNILHVGLYDV